MIKNVKITTPFGETFTLYPESPEKSLGLFIRSIDGLGPSKADVNMGSSLYNDGGYFNSSRLNGRNLVFDLGFYNDYEDTVEEIRNSTYRMFPFKKAVTIDILTDTKYVTTYGYVESNEPDIFSKDAGTHISMLCPSAYFWDKSTVTSGLTGSTGGFEFPFSNESLTDPLLEFAQLFINSTTLVKYTGEAEVGITAVLTFSGTASGVTINNLSKGTTFAIDSTKVAAIVGSGFQAGDVLTINTIRFNKFATLRRGSTDYNILNAVSTSADWFQIDRGTTSFSVTASAGASNITYTITHQAIYYGV